MVFPVVMYRELDHKEGWVLKNWCFQTVVLEKTLENSLDNKEIKLVNPKANQARTFIRSWSTNTLTTWYKQPAQWKRAWFWENLRVGGERGDRGWDGWMASPSQWTWVWVDSGSWWCTGRPGVLQFMGLQRVGHDWMTELNWRDTIEFSSFHCTKLQWEVCNCKGALTWLFWQSDLRLPASRTFRKIFCYL